MRTGVRYSIAVLTTVVAIALSLAFGEFLAPMRLFFLWCAVLVSALAGGLGPALLAIALSVAGAGFMGLMPVREGEDVLRLILFVLFASAISASVGRTAALSQRLRASERRYRSLVEATPVPQAVWTAAADGTIRWSDGWLAITGQTYEEVQQGGGMSAVHPDDAARTWERWTGATRTGVQYEDVIRVRVRGGGYRWFAVRAVPVEDRGKIQEWVGLVVDVHERKLHEEHASFINRASEVLASSLGYQQTMRNLARLCVPSIADWCGIDIGSGPDYVRLAVEHADPRKLELLQRLGTGRPPADKDPILQAMRSGRTQLLPELSDELLASLSQSPEQLALARELGLKSWIIAPMIARGRTLGTLTVVHADSDRRYSAEDVPLVEEIARRAAMALDNARLYEAAEAANRAKDEFLATLSHELRTPLTAISGWAHMLQTGMTDDTTSRLAIDTIVRSARSQAELIDDLLDLSRVVAGTLHLDVRDVDLVLVAEDAVVAARPAAEARGLRLELSAVAPLLVRGDERRLRQIVWNLVSNAVKFTDRGGSVLVSVEPSGPNALLSVHDTGRGIEPEFLPLVWDRFRQADSSTSREHGGLGLGLAVVRHLAELHGGSVRAVSGGRNQGATFMVELPLVRVEEAPQSSTPPAAGEAPLRGRAVLLVEDDDASRVVIAAMLRRLGADVVAAEAVTSALAAFGERRFDAVITDIAMPGEDGYVLVRKLRERSRVPVIAVSAISMGPEDRERALAAGFADFVRKPLDMQQLGDALLKQI
jgi:PAS domain S-box-containing protein